MDFQVGLVGDALRRLEVYQEARSVTGITRDGVMVRVSRVVVKRKRKSGKVTRGFDQRRLAIVLTVGRQSWQARRARAQMVKRSGGVARTRFPIWYYTFLKK